jgi:hypothetical protein
MGRKPQWKSYENLLKKLNKDTQKTQCECGKYVTPMNLEKHKTTRYHLDLLQMKARSEGCIPEV